MDTDRNYAVYHFEDADVYAVDKGGPYIDLYQGDDLTPFDTINVWDYEKAERTVHLGGEMMLVKNYLRDEGIL